MPATSRPRSDPEPLRRGLGLRKVGRRSCWLREFGLALEPEVLRLCGWAVLVAWSEDSLRKLCST